MAVSCCSDLGVHIDGFIATQAQTIVVGAGAEPIKGKTADAILAARTAFDAALRLIRPGKSVGDVAGPLNQVGTATGTQLCAAGSKSA